MSTEFTIESGSIGKYLVLSDRWETSEQLNLYTDASNIGFGGLFRKHWFAIKWPTDWLKYHITIREFFPIVVAIQCSLLEVDPSMEILL
jgi:hypothetical protein